MLVLRLKKVRKEVLGYWYLIEFGVKFFLGYIFLFFGSLFGDMFELFFILFVEKSILIVVNNFIVN